MGTAVTPDGRWLVETVVLDRGTGPARYLRVSEVRGGRRFVRDYCRTLGEVAGTGCPVAQLRRVPAQRRPVD